MPTPFDVIGGNNRGRGVQVYTPGRTLIPQPEQNTRRPLPGGPPQGGNKTAMAFTRVLAENGGNTKPAAGGFGGVPGLGVLANVFEGGLKVADVGRRAVTLGIEEATDINNDDKRSNVEKLWGDEKYGVKDWIGEDSMPSWMRSKLGFAGDVLLDPLTYLTAGVGGVAGKSGRAGYAAKASLFGREAVEEAVRLGADDIAIAAIKSQSDDAVRKIARYGPGVVKDQVLLEKLGLQKQGLRFGRPFSPGKGLRIGGDTKLGDALGEVARGTNKFVAGGRAKFYDTRIGGKLQDWRSPEIISKAQHVLRSGESVGTMDHPMALAMTTFYNGNRMASKAFAGKWGPSFNHLTKGMDNAGAVSATELAEKEGPQTLWNAFFDQIGKAAKDQGVSFDMRKNYVPHIPTKEGNAVLRENKDVRAATGLIISHLDDPSGVTMARGFTGGKHMIGDVEVDFGKGTISEINRALKPVLGVDKFFEDNMTVIVPNYLKRMSSDVGTMAGLGRASEMFPQLVRNSEDPRGLADIFTQVIDDAATGTANKEALTLLNARLSAVNKAAGSTADEVGEAVEKGRSVLSDAAGEHLDSIRTMRDTTRDQLRGIEANEKSLLKRQDKMAALFDNELDSMAAKIKDIQTRIRSLEFQEQQAMKALDGLDVSAEMKAASQARASQFSAKKRELQAIEKEMTADRELLYEVNRRVRSHELRQAIIARNIDDESFIQLAGGAKRADITGATVYDDAGLERIGASVDPEAQRAAIAQKYEGRREAARMEDNAQKVAATYGDPPRDLDRVQQDVTRKAARARSEAQGELDTYLTSAEGKAWTSAHDVVVGLREAAESVRAEGQALPIDLMRATSGDRALKLRKLKSVLDSAEAKLAEAEDAMTAAFGPQATTRRIERLTASVAESADDGTVARLTAKAEAELERSPLLSPQDKRSLTVARKTETGAEQEMNAFFDSPQGQQWLDERSLIDEEVDALRNPAVRRKNIHENQLGMTPAGAKSAVPGKAERELRVAKLDRSNARMALQTAMEDGGNVGAARAKLTAADRHLKEVQAMVDDILKRTNPATAKITKLNAKRLEARNTINRLADSAESATFVKGTDQSHLELGAILDSIDDDEAEALRRLGKGTRTDENFHLSKAPRMEHGRVRLPLTESEIKADLAVLEASGAPLNIPEGARKVLESTPVVYAYASGSRNPVDIATAILDHSSGVQKYRRFLAHSGAITAEEASAHSAMVLDVQAAKEAMEAAGHSATHRQIQELVTSADNLKRMNNFMAKYAQVIDAGAEPSDELARRVLRPIMTKDIEKLDALITRVSKDSSFIDEEAQAMFDAVQEAVEDYSGALSLRERARTIAKTKELSPEMKRAKDEEWLHLYKERFLPNEERGLKMHQARRRRAIKANNEKAIINADRGIAYFQKKIEHSRRYIKAAERDLAEDRGGASLLDISDLQHILDALGGGAREMTDEQAMLLTKYFGDENVTAIRQLLQEDEFTLQDLREVILKDVATPANQPLPAVSYTTPNGTIRSVSPDSELVDLVASAAAIQSSKDIESARAMFSEAFDTAGVGRRTFPSGEAPTYSKSGTGLSKELSVGYKTSNDTFKPEVLRDNIRTMLERERGASSKDFALRDLKARRARLETINRGLGKGRKNRSEILEMIPGEGAARVAREEAIDPRFLDRIPATQLDPTATMESVRDSRIAAIDTWSDVKPNDDFVEWREAVFGDTMRQRPRQPAPGEAGRGPGMIVRDSPASKRRGLEAQLNKLQETRAGLQDMSQHSEQALGSFRPMAADAEQRLATGGARADELTNFMDETRGSPLLPELEDAKARVQSGFDEKIGPKKEELEQLQVRKQAYEKGQQKAMAQLAPEIAETRRDLASITEALYGPQVDTAIPMGPAGSSGQPLPAMSSSTELAIPQVDPNRLALPAAGQTSGPANAGLEEKFKQAADIAKQLQRKQTKIGMEMGGAQAIARDFEKVMGDIGLDETAATQVRSLLADAVSAEKKAALLARSAKALETNIGLANNNKLKVITKDLLLGSWEPMAEGLMRGLDDEAKYFMSRDLARYFTNIDSALKDGKFWKAIESYTAYFKTYATMRPDFHVRNAMSAMFMNATDGVPLGYNGKALRAWKKFESYADGDFVAKLREAPEAESFVKGFTNGQMADAFDVTLGSGAGGQFAERGVGGGLTGGNKLINNPATRLSRKVGEFVEGPARLAAAMDALKNQNMDKWDAFARVTRLHFDYSEVSKMDEYAKRFIPFWTFMSRNLPLQLTQVVGKPRWYAGFNSFKRNFAAEGDPLAPEYWSDGGGFALGGRIPILSDLMGQGENDQLWLTPDLAHNRIRSDMQNIGDLITMKNPGAMLTSLNPVFTAPAEMALGRDLFTGQTYEEDDVQKLGGLEKGLEPILALLGASKDGVVQQKYLNFGKSLNPLWDQMGRLLPQVTQGSDPNAVRASQQRNNFARYAGAPVRQLTDEQRAATARSQYYDGLRQQDIQEAMQRALAQ